VNFETQCTFKSLFLLFVSTLSPRKITSLYSLRVTITIWATLDITQRHTDNF